MKILLIIAIISHNLWLLNMKKIFIQQKRRNYIAIDISKCDNKFICCVRALIYFPEPITYITGDEIGYYCVSPSLNGKPTVSIELPP